MNNDFRVVLSGGLGNQLFQITAGMHAAKQNGLRVNFVSAPTKFSKYTHEDEIRDLVNLPIPTWSRSANQRSSIEFRAKRKVATSSSQASKLLKISAPQQIGYSTDLTEINSGWTMTGYYQSYRYLTNVISDVRQIIKNPLSSNWAMDMASLISNKDFTSLHIRRGDYEKLSDRFGLLDFEYYESAMKTINSKTGKNKFLVFSDDIQASKRLLAKSQYEIDFVEPPAGAPSRESLGLMWLCGNHIIANSSFSWWGAALATEDGLTIAPTQWMKNGEQIRDLLPGEWVQVDSRWVN